MTRRIFMAFFGALIFWRKKEAMPVGKHCFKTVHAARPLDDAKICCVVFRPATKEELWMKSILNGERHT